MPQPLAADLLLQRSVGDLADRGRDRPEHRQKAGKLIPAVGPNEKEFSASAACHQQDSNVHERRASQILPPAA